MIAHPLFTMNRRHGAMAGLMKITLIVGLMIASVGAADAQLRSVDMQADYIIIAPMEFEGPLKSYSNWRRAQHMTVVVATPLDINYGFGSIGSRTLKPDVMRAFISYALQYWKDPKPRYLLLTGDAEWVPSVRVPSLFASDSSMHEDTVSIDEWFAVNQYERDTKPDIAVGRIPVKTPDQLKTVLKKIQMFEDSLSRKSYANDMLFITDRDDAADFELEVDGFIAETLPASYRRMVLRFGDATASGGTRRKLFDAIGTSTLFFSNYVHGNPSFWSRQRIFTAADVDSLPENHRPFILTSSACSQRFDVMADSVIVEKLLAKPNGGAVAAFAAAGLSYLSEDALLLRDVYRNVFSGRFHSIGDVILDAKRTSGGYTNDAESLAGNVRRYTLLGDPAMRLPRDLLTGVIPAASTAPLTFALEQNFPNPCNPGTTIRYSIPTDAMVTITVFDVLGRVVAEPVRAMKNAGSHDCRFNAEGLASGPYIYRLRAGEFVSAKMMSVTK